MANKYFAPIETIDEANKAIRNASVMAVIAGFITIIFIILGYEISRSQGPFTYLNLYDVTLSFTLAYLLYYRKSRTSAVVMLVYYLISKIITLNSISSTSVIWIILFAYIYFRGVQGSFAYARLNNRKTLPWQLIIRNTLVFLFWIATSFYFSAFASSFIFGYLGVIFEEAGYSILALICGCIILPLISILGSFNKLPGVTVDLHKEPYKRKIKMFQNMYSFGFNRSMAEAMGFYIVYLIYLLMISALISSAIYLFGLQGVDFYRVGSIVAFIGSTLIAGAILYKKGFYKNPLYVILSMVGVGVAIMGGAVLSLIILAYMTTIPSIEGADEEKVYAAEAWYHKPLSVISMMVVGVLIGAFIIYNPQTASTYEEYYQSPYKYLAKVFYAEKQKIYLPAASSQGLMTLTYEDIGIKRRILPIENIANLYRQVIVAITTYDKKGKLIGVGSGIVITPNGFIVTNYHVMSGAYTAKVVLANGEEYNDVFYLDEFLGQGIDACVIKVNASDLLPAMMGDARKSVVGEKIYTVGNPMGMYGSISDGIISGFRDIGDITLMQITAPISPGSSGGPVINKYGEVIGISTLSSQTGQYQNINFAVPINYLLRGK